jgi:hypothetical protein
MNLYKIYTLTLLLFLSTVNAQENNVEGLTVTFTKVTEDYLEIATYNGNIVPLEAIEGMKLVKLKLTLKNEGQKDCQFDFSSTYLSTEKDSLYPFTMYMNYNKNTIEKIKPKKKVNRVILFEFPDNATPNELFIEDKRYKVIEEK